MEKSGCCCCSLCFREEEEEEEKEDLLAVVVIRLERWKKRVLLQAAVVVQDKERSSATLSIPIFFSLCCEGGEKDCKGREEDREWFLSFFLLIQVLHHLGISICNVMLGW